MADQTISDVDRGYAWVILAASFWGHVMEYGVVWTVGVFYVVFLENFSVEGKGAIALISSLQTSVFYVTGIVAGVLTNKFGCRKVALMGSLLGAAGLVLSMFAKSIYHLYVTFGILTGLGLGLAYIPTITIVGFYFEKYRSIAIGLSTSGTGLGTFIYPPLIRLFLHNFDWKGTLLLLGGTTLNLCVCAALFRPIKMKSDENKNIIKDSKKDILNLSIFKNIKYLLMCANNFFICFGLSVVYVHLSAYGTSLGFTSDQGAMLFSALGIANFLGRMLFGFLAHLPYFRPVSLYCIFLSLAGLATAICPLTTSYEGMMVFAGVFGLFTASFGSLLPCILVDILDLNVLTSAYGYILAFEAFGTLLGGPFAGWLYESTCMYHVSLYLGGAVLILGSLPVTYVWWNMRRSPLPVLEHRTASVLDLYDDQLLKKKPVEEDTEVLTAPAV